MKLLKIITYVFVIVGWYLIFTSITNWDDKNSLTAFIIGVLFVVLGDLISPSSAIKGYLKGLKNPNEEPRAAFSIISPNDDRDKIAELIQDEKYLEGVYGEEGRKYSRPDSDDNEKWFALRVYSREKYRDELMDRVTEKIETKFGSSFLSKLNITYF